MTKSEYSKYRNPDDKHHSSEAYDPSYTKLNETLSAFGSANVDGYDYSIHKPSGGGQGYAFIREGHIAAVLHKGVMYHSSHLRPSKLPTGYGRGMEWHDFDIKRYKAVKYPSEYVHLISNLAERNRKQYNHLLQHVMIKGEPCQIRSEGVPKPNKGTTLAVLDSKGQVVAQASNEWGATLITVAREFRGRGFGNILIKQWYKYNPNFQSGGYTPSGEGFDLSVWEDRVKEFLSNGWYSELVRQKKLTTQRVKDILKGTTKRHRFSPLPSDAPPKPKSKKSQILIYAQDLAFVVYDSAFLDNPDEKYIHGYGFFRDSPSVGDFLYTLDYDRPYWKSTTLAAFQMAKDEGFEIYVGEGYGDTVEIEGIPEIKQEGDYASLTRNVMPLRQMATLERKLRRKGDMYGEMRVLLLEMGESKWR